ncbi:MAG: hypothetical protein HC905_20320 [Bacteroidales bacterium]|nr:hypothetical protein [Bacteroidales bacterium]
MKNSYEYRYIKSKLPESDQGTKIGICDDNNQNIAYFDLVNESNWIAMVNNSENKEIVFTAFDYCIDVFRENGEMDKRCDVLMTFEESLYFIELKSKVSDWQSEGIEQIEVTINNFINKIPDYYWSFKKRKAYVANKRHPSFNVTKITDMERFRDQYHVRLDLQATILIK